MNDFDILIPSSPKDLHKVKYVIESAKKHIKDDIGNIYIVTPFMPKEEDKLEDVIYIMDHEVLDDYGIKLRDIPFKPTWMFQMMIKLFNSVTENDRYLVVDSDLFFNKPISFFDENKKPIFYLGRNQNHSHYFRFMQKMFGFGRVYPHSFISEVMLFDRNITTHMFNGLPKKEFIQKFISNINSNDYPACFETFGNYTVVNFPDKYEIKHFTMDLEGRLKKNWTEDEIKQRLEFFSKNPNVDVFTLHTWEVYYDY
jgi:hypothetical protein